ncbi:proteasome assembly chaperone 4-like [Pomacea canaliculata]|uniref:proteasome assembly chaperone 4-like n=1 Tax=Pomacea canaliculata TaxID=400727 RepID=UPI000D736421|nr:proteasome assembly chaperone 4-like [Pomacea canaliculata]
MDVEGKMSSTAVSDPQISVHDFSDRLLGNDVYFHVIKLCNSFQVFIGIKPVLSNLAVAMRTKYDKGVPTGSIVYGDTSDTVSLTIAQKLAKSTGKQVFVSCSIPYDQNLFPLVEKRLSEEIKLQPDKF